MQDSVQVKPVGNIAFDTRLDLEHAMRAKQELTHVAQFDLNLACSNGAEAHLRLFRLQAKYAAWRNSIHAKENVIANRDSFARFQKCLGVSNCLIFC